MAAKKKTEKKETKKAVKKEVKEKPKKEGRKKEAIREKAAKETAAEKKADAKKTEVKAEGRKIKGIIFDFWGTLVENGVFPSPIKRVRFILRLDMSFSEYVVAFEEALMKQKFRDLYEGFSNVCRTFGIREHPKMMDILVGMWNKNKMLAKPYDETVSVLEGLKSEGYKLALISNTDCFSLRDVLQKYDLEKYFDSVVLSCEVNMLKSDPAMFRKVLDDLGLQEDEAIMVGDSIESDIKSADRAGVKPVLIDRRNRMEFNDKILSLKEIGEFIKKAESE
ncbi:hypothetical protein COV19_06760 [Candidatus Woesearchaeota archaeon CG10_big_fil_rev_8_21_14_0_10_44_13]|nr:MAG: hypothetical protein COV19_06760 [Candidatus Woesearchaeota archaeon CG10_big_fil_rev_8_21_14_0_10_44_13]